MPNAMKKINKRWREEIKKIKKIEKMEGKEKQTKMDDFMY